MAWARGNCQEPPHHGKDCQVVSRAHGARHNICPTNGNQVPGIGELRGKMDGNATTAYPSDPRALEHVLRWLLYPQWGKGRHHSNLSQGRSTPLCDSTMILINGLRIAIELGVQRLYIRDNSELVVNQIMGSRIAVTPTWRHTTRR
jgi:hypothetical protein